MRGVRVLFFLLMIAAGVLLGLLFGWIIQPVTRAPDTSPQSLRADYRADYALMVAEVYAADGNLEQAARRLSLLGSLPPSQYVFEGILTARTLEYAAEDLDLMTRLAVALESAGGESAARTPTTEGAP